MENKISSLPFPFIGMFDLDLIYQTSDVELLYQLINKTNELINSVNLINSNIQQYCQEILDQYLAEGKLAISTSYDAESGTLTFNFTKLEG